MNRPGMKQFVLATMLMAGATGVAQTIGVDLGKKGHDVRKASMVFSSKKSTMPATEACMPSS